jgi:hypothetical protein
MANKSPLVGAENFEVSFKYSWVATTKTNPNTK